VVDLRVVVEFGRRFREKKSRRGLGAEGEIYKEERKIEKMRARG